MTNVNYGEKFRQNLIYLRTSRGLGQVKLAEEIGVSKGCISLWENGLREPSMSCLIALATYFDVSIDELVGII